MLLLIVSLTLKLRKLNIPIYEHIFNDYVDIKGRSVHYSLFQHTTIPSIFEVDNFVNTLKLIVENNCILPDAVQEHILKNRDTTSFVNNTPIFHFEETYKHHFEKYMHSSGAYAVQYYTSIPVTEEWLKNLCAMNKFE